LKVPGAAHFSDRPGQTKPGNLNYASSGVGSIAHLAGALFNSLAEFKDI
jgi:hypothetical protein